VSNREGMLRSLVTLAASDGKIAKRELELIESLSREWGLDGEVLTQAIKDVEAGQRPVMVPQDSAERLELLRALTLVTVADGVIAKEERAILDAVAKRLSLSEAVVDDLLAEAQGKSANSGSLREVSCPLCNTAQRVPGQFLGKSVECEACKQAFVAGDDDTPTAESRQANEEREQRKRQQQAEWKKQQEREKRLAKVVVAGAIATVAIGALVIKFGMGALGTFVATTLLIVSGIAVLGGIAWALWQWEIARQRQAKLRAAGAANSPGFDLGPQQTDTLTQVVGALVVVPLVLFCCVFPSVNSSSSGGGSSNSLERFAKEGAIMAPTEAALDRLATASSDYEVFARVLVSDNYHPLAVGTRVKIMSAGFTVHKIMDHGRT
jgi:uncharacterized membrane protein YebE (DUF533 family)